MKANENRQEIQDLISLFRKGDQQAFNRLLQRYEPLVRTEVYRYACYTDLFDADEFRQVALIALYRATLNFDLTQSEVEFGLYAKICIANALASHYRSLVRQGHLVDISASLPADVDRGEDPAAEILAEEAAQSLLVRIRKLLSPYENDVWSLYMAGVSAKEIARVLGKEQHSIENAIYRIRCKLRRQLSAREE